MGFTPDRRGLLPSNDVEKAAEVGRFLNKCYGQALASMSAQQLSNAEDFIDLRVDGGAAVDRIWLREDISSGQRAQEFTVLAQMSTGGQFSVVVNGTSIARKRVVVLSNEIKPVVLRFKVDASLEWPVPIHEVAAFASCVE